MFYDIVRSCPTAPRIVLEGDGDRSVLAIRAGALALHAADLAENDFFPISPPAT